MIRVSGILFFSSLLFLVSCNSLIDKHVETISLIPVSNGTTCHFINSKGSIEITPQFSYATTFTDGLALVRSLGDYPKWGFVDEKGRYKIPAQYRNATAFANGVAWVVQDEGAPTAINEDGEILFTLQAAEEVCPYSESLAAFSTFHESGKLWGFVDTRGTIIITPQFQKVRHFSGGKCAVKNDQGKWGFIDQRGRIVINNQFDEALDFRNGYAPVGLSDKMGLIDESGRYVVNPQFRSMESDGERYLINMEGKYGWCDREGKITINPQFDKAFCFLEGDLAPVKIGSNYGYCDKDGRVTINPQFESAYPYFGELALVKMGGKYGFINREGSYVINPQYDVAIDYFIDRLTKGNDPKDYTISTDFIDLESIASGFDIDNWWGVSLNSTAGELKQRVRQGSGVMSDAYPFQEYGRTYQLDESRAVGKDVSVTLSIEIYPFKEIMDGWYPKNVFDAMARPDVLVFEMTFESAKAVQKQTRIMDAVRAKLAGWAITDRYAQNFSTGEVYTKGNNVLWLDNSSGRIKLHLMSINRLGQETGSQQEYYYD
jgi:DNA-binding transcriptional regulator/RsmH inhibitor MraZ